MSEASKSGNESPGAGCVFAIGAGVGAGAGAGAGRAVPFAKSDGLVLAAPLERVTGGRIG